jgi:hypothetical protein
MNQSEISKNAGREARPGKSRKKTKTSRRLQRREANITLDFNDDRDFDIKRSSMTEKLCRPEEV